MTSNAWGLPSRSRNSGAAEDTAPVTLFTVPKPFVGHLGIIQTNALESWLRLRPMCEVIVFGDEIGLREIAKRLRLTHVPDVDRNEFGTPLLNSVFSAVENVARTRFLCYVNADIILTDDLISAVQRVPCAQFLMIGQRKDLDLRRPLGFTGDWRAELANLVASKGTLHPPTGSDYFVFPRGGLGRAIPPFAVGRPGWDNWFIYHARSLRLPVIDASRAVTAVHQNHDYSHMIGGIPEDWGGPEADVNRRLIPDERQMYTPLDSTHTLSRTQMSRALAPRYLRRRWQVARMARKAG